VTSVNGAAERPVARPESMPRPEPVAPRPDATPRQEPAAAPAPLRPAAALQADAGMAGAAVPNTGGLSVGGMNGGGYRQPPSYADAPSGPRTAEPPLPVRGAEPSLPVRGVEPSLPVRGAEPPLPVRSVEPSLPVRGVEPSLPARGGEPRSWESAGDAGWKAAEALRQPDDSGKTSTTRAGLPLRVPMTHLIPGSAEPASNRKPPPRPADAATRSPEAVGGRLASFYQGVRQGRDMGAETRSARRDGQEER
jgi:hypothetical protein